MEAREGTADLGGCVGMLPRMRFGFCLDEGCRVVYAGGVGSSIVCWLLCVSVCWLWGVYAPWVVES
jgi:hypothetical protein